MTMRDRFGTVQIGECKIMAEAQKQLLVDFFEMFHLEAQRLFIQRELT
jgi:hypothetical protein